MIFRESSKNSSVFSSSFRYSLRLGGTCGIFYFLFMLFILPIQTAIRLSAEKEDGMTTMRNTYVYVLAEDGESALLLTALTVIFSIAMGMALFRFLLLVRTANIYGSLGMKRSSLFLSRYPAGLLLLFLCIAVPFLLCGIVSGAFLGFNTALLWGVLINIACYFSLSAVCFTVFVCIACGVGTLLESICFSLLFLAFPSVLFGGLSLCGAALLYGCAYSLSSYVDSSGITVENSGLFSLTSNCNPLTFAYTNTSPYLTVYRSEGDKINLCSSYGSSDIAWSRPQFTACLLWLLFAAVLACFAVLVFRRRRMEIAGFIGMNSSLNRISSFFLGTCAYFLSFLILQNNRIIAMVIGVLVMFAVTCLVLLFLTRRLKSVLCQLPLLLLQPLSVTAVFLVLITGGFGYSTKLPSVESIAYAEISAVSFHAAPQESGINNTSVCYSDVTYPYCLEPVLFGQFTSPNDIEQIHNIHSKFIELGSENLEDDTYLNTQMLIKYTLKNGHTLLRYYTRADEATLELCLNLEESECFRQNIQKAFTQSNVPSLQYGSGRVVAVGASLSDDAFHVLSLSEKQHSALKQAIADDLCRQTKEQRFFPQKPAVGAIWFEEKQADEDFLREPLFLHYSPDNATFEPTVYLTSDMTQTISFLKENNLTDFFKAPCADDVASLSFYPAAIDRNSSGYKDCFAFTLDLHAFRLNTALEEDESTEKLTRQNTVTDRKQIAEILPKLHMRYFTQEKGYFCCITYQNGTKVIQYLTEDDAPDFVRYYEYQ